MIEHIDDEKYMRRCLQLARNGCQRVRPNPQVGAVVVSDGRILGEGYHVRYGEAHAEVNALRNLTAKQLSRATLYVSLEPCVHFGKTPPCTELIIERQIPKVVVGCTDPFPEVAGRGIARLREAGCEVKTGVLEHECRLLNRTFFTFHTRKRPYILLKWAESADGYIDSIRTGGVPVQLSDEISLARVHKRRAEVDAIIVGSQTALLDNPRLTTRRWAGPNPLRITIDRHLRLPRSLHLFDRSVPTLIFTAEKAENSHNLTFVTIDDSNDVISQILNELYARKIQTLMVEGGRQLLQSFIDRDLWDEANIERCPIWLQQGVSAPRLSVDYQPQMGLQVLFNPFLELF